MAGENIKILTEEDIEREMQSLQEWKREDDKIVKQFEFKDFVDALDFINNLMPFFQENDHHPDINWSYKKITFSLTRYDAGGKLTDKDFSTARKIDSEYTERN